SAIASISSAPSCASGTGTSGTDIRMVGNPTLSMPGCTITSDSTGAKSIDLNGNTNITAFSIYTSGGIQSKPSNLNLTVSPTTYGKVLTDPYKITWSPSSQIPTLPTVPSLPTSATTPTFPTLSSAPNAPSVNPQSVRTLTCDSTKSTNAATINNLGSNLCFT